MYDKETTSQRRSFLKTCAGIAVGVCVPTISLASTGAGERKLGFVSLHTGESVTATYWSGGNYIPDELGAINKVLRDHRTGEVYPMDPNLLDMLYTLQSNVGSNKPFSVISGYRSPKTNAMLNSNSSGVAKRSLHMKGEAIDIRLPGVELANLRKAALAMKAGGVGYYPKSEFIHVDTGRVRFW